MTNLKKIIFALSLIAPVLFTGCWGGDIGDLAVAKIDGIKSSTTNDTTTGSTVDNRYHYVAVGDAGAIWISKDGLTWEDKSVGGANLNGVAWCGNQFVAVSDKIYTSPDGVTWTYRFTSPYILRAVTYGFISPNNWCMTMGDADPSNFLTYYRSSDGINWSKPLGPSGPSIYSAAYGNNSFTGVGAAYGGPNYSGSCSTDAESFNPSSVGGNITFWAIIYANSKFLAAGDANSVQQSIDGLNWSTSVTSGAIPINARAIAYGNGSYIISGFKAGPIVSISKSTNGTDWTNYDTVFSAECHGIVFGNGKFIAVGQNGLIISSPDGSNAGSWSGNVNTAGSANLNAIAYRP